MDSGSSSAVANTVAITLGLPLLVACLPRRRSVLRIWYLSGVRQRQKIKPPSEKSTMLYGKSPDCNVFELLQRLSSHFLHLWFHNRKWVLKLSRFRLYGMEKL